MKLLFSFDNILSSNVKLLLSFDNIFSVLYMTRVQMYCFRLSTSPDELIVCSSQYHCTFSLIFYYICFDVLGTHNNLSKMQPFSV